jgi:hypothetical protein
MRMCSGGAQTRFFSAGVSPPDRLGAPIAPGVRRYGAPARAVSLPRRDRSGGRGKSARPKGCGSPLASAGVCRTGAAEGIMPCVCPGTEAAGGMGSQRRVCPREQRR